MELIEQLHGQLGSIAAGEGEVSASSPPNAPKKRRMSAAARARIAAGARARWARAKGTLVAPKAAKKVDRPTASTVRV